MLIIRNMNLISVQSWTYLKIGGVLRQEPSSDIKDLMANADNDLGD